MTQLSRAVSEQMATVTSPSAVAIEKADAARVPATPTQPPVATQVSPDNASERPPREAMKAAAEQIESYLKSVGRELQFSVDEETGETVITVRDASTGEIVRQIPKAEAMRIAHSLGSRANVLIDISI